MTTKPYECWSCEYFNPLDPVRFKDGRCHRHAPHALDFFGFESAGGSTILADKGDLLTRNATDEVAFPVGADGQVLTADSASPEGISWEDGFASPLTSKGDLFGRDATGDARLPVGTDGQVLQADSAEPTGLKWTTSGGTSPLTTKGDIYTRNGSADERLPVGSDGQILVADAAEPTGQKWQNNPGNSFIVQYQVGRLNENMQNNLFNLARNGLAPASGTNFPVANGYTIFNNGDIHPFAIPANGEIIAMQMCFTAAAVGVGAVGASPYLRVYVVENGGSSETVRGTVDIPIDPSYVDINNNLGTANYFCVTLKIAVPITFTGTALWGLRIDLSNNTSDVQVSAARNLELIAYARVPISDVLDSGIAPLAMAMAPTPSTDKETVLSTDSVKSAPIMALSVEAPLPGTDAVSEEKYAYIPDGETFWCGEYKRKSGAILPLP